MPASDQGVNFDRYMLVPRTLILLTSENKVLLLKGADDKRLWAGLFNGVGGHVEKGEDILSSARRELYEETGLNVDNLFLCGIVTVDTQTNPGVCIYIFTAECLDCKPIMSKEGNLTWIDTSEIENISLVPDLHTLLPRILAYDPGTLPFIAHTSYDEFGNMVTRIK